MRSLKWSRHNIPRTGVKLAKQKMLVIVRRFALSKKTEGGKEEKKQKNKKEAKQGWARWPPNEGEGGEKGSTRESKRVISVKM